MLVDYFSSKGGITMFFDKDPTKRIPAFLNQYPLISQNELKNHPFSDLACEDPIWKIATNEEGKLPFSKDFIHMLLYVRNINKAAFNTVEGKQGCIHKSWNALEHNPQRHLFGGGVMTTIRETILEKSAVNMSVVYGPKYPGMESEYAGKPFAAAGVSLISHPKNPNAPIMHLNVRSIQVFDKDKTHTWIGGGADLTPMVVFDEDTQLFHKAMETACLRNPKVGNYDKYRKWADEYFYLPHRKEIRGVGGIFFDFVPLEDPNDFSFLLDVGQFAARAYTEILQKRIDIPYDETLLEKHHYWRGRYAEFNLAFDRGTRFGLMTGGNHEAIFCSLPPIVKW
jgi:coproporphyrinogen III oxidase